MALNGQIVGLEILRTLDNSLVAGTYIGVGTPFQNPARLIMIDNLTNADLYISDDGINDKIALPARSGRVLDWASNKVAPVDQLEQRAGTRIYVRAISTLPSSGNVCVSVAYAATT